MKRLEITIEEDLDAELALQAARERVSKGTLIRRYLREGLRVGSERRHDSIWDIVGMISGGPEDSSRVDEVVYDDLG
jgi:hypothetical protein